MGADRKPGLLPPGERFLSSLIVCVICLPLGIPFLQIAEVMHCEFYKFNFWKLTGFSSLGALPALLCCRPESIWLAHTRMCSVGLRSKGTLRDGHS